MTNKMEGGRIGWMTAKEPTMSQEALADYEMQKQACMEVNKLNDDFEYIDYPISHKSLGENEGRIGYFHVCEDGEINAEPINVCEYEINRRPVRLPC